MIPILPIVKEWKQKQKESHRTTLMFCDSIKMGSYLSDALSFVIVKKMIFTLRSELHKRFFPIYCFILFPKYENYFLKFKIDFSKYYFE